MSQTQTVPPQTIKVAASNPLPCGTLSAKSEQPENQYVFIPNLHGRQAVKIRLDIFLMAAEEDEEEEERIYAARNHSRHLSTCSSMSDFSITSANELPLINQERTSRALSPKTRVAERLGTQSLGEKKKWRRATTVALVDPAPEVDRRVAADCKSHRRFT
ncbi:hypothetical protein BC567DRAFT_249956 [Phyllosticta citribraziliensis]